MLSVVIVNYKVPFLLETCVEKVIASRYPDTLEIIIVDNASNDNSQKIILQRFPQVIWIQNNANLGFATAVNIGIRKASGDFILLLNPDCELDPDAILNIEEFARTHPDAGVVGGKMVNTDGTFQKQCRRNIPKPGPAFFRLFGLVKLFPNHSLSTAYELPLDTIDTVHEVEAVSGAMLCTPRAVWEEIGGFDEGYFLFGEDLDYCWRVLKSHRKIFYCPTAIVYHVRGASRRKRPVRTLWHIHYAMHRFFKKHQADELICVIRWMIFGSIWMRWFFMTLHSAAYSSFERKKN